MDIKLHRCFIFMTFVILQNIHYSVGGDFCYLCGYLGDGPDNCSPGNLNPDAEETLEYPCETGECFVVSTGGVTARGCTDTSSGLFTCGVDGFECCQGNLCNGDPTNCYVCTYSGEGPDECSPGNFNPDSFGVKKSSCQSGQCYILNKFGSIARGCTSMTVGTHTCGDSDEFQCCQGSFCNGENNHDNAATMATILGLDMLVFIIIVAGASLVVIIGLLIVCCCCYRHGCCNCCCKRADDSRPIQHVQEEAEIPPRYNPTFTEPNPHKDRHTTPLALPKNNLQGNKYDVMISYAWGAAEDGFPCQRMMVKLKDELKKAGYKVWMDVDYMRDNMDDKMAYAVQRSAVILMCLSKEYQRSESCKKEAQYAKYNKKPIICLKYDGHEPSDWLGLMICMLIHYDVRTEYMMMKNLPAIKGAIEDMLHPSGSPYLSLQRLRKPMPIPSVNILSE
ncbi:uncharacterized protein [Amphiura filiformis]|uniref:uncharacterized protein n=1 Tax=Amphiura filiformis TaxID=82378 RepID=UPI003B21B6FD